MLRQLRLIHGSPDEVNLDLSVDSKVVATNIGYEAASAYVAVSAGTHQIVLNQTGTTNALLSQSVTISSSTSQSLLATNYASTLAGVTLTDDLTAPTSGNFKLRIVNAAPAAGSVDVYILPTSTDYNTVSPTISGLAFESASTYQSLAAGTFQVTITQAGTKFLLAQGTSTAYTANQIRTVLALNQPFGGFTTATITDLN